MINNDESVMQALSDLANLTNADDLDWENMRINFGRNDDDSSRKLSEIVEHELIPHILAQVQIHKTDLQPKKMLLALKLLMALGISESVRLVRDGSCQFMFEPVLL